MIRGNGSTRRYTEADWTMKGRVSILVLFLFTISYLASAYYIHAQFDLSPKMAVYKEIAEDCYPSTICDKEGNIHVVWMGDRKGNWDIYYTSFKDDQVSRKEFDNLTVDLNDEIFPSLAEDQNGDIWVAWIKFESSRSLICGKILKNQNNEWDKETVLVSSEDGCEKKSPCLTSIGSEKMLLCWLSKNETKQEIKYAIIQKNLIGQSKTLCTTYNAQKVFLGKTEEGRTFALWDSMSVGRNVIYFSIFEEHGEYFIAPQPLISSTGDMIFGDSATLVIRREKPSVLFFRNESSDIFYSVESGSQDTSERLGFSQPLAIFTTAAIEDDPVAIENGKGEIYLFWASKYGGDNEIFFLHDTDIENFLKKRIQYAKNPNSTDMEIGKFVENLTMDPNQQNSSPDGYFCDDIFFSVAVIKEELWLVWDSYYWDPIGNNNVRRIKLMKTLDGYHWSQPMTVVDSSKSGKNGRDDRHPAITGTEDGNIWLFWHSDRYRMSKDDDNFEICFIRSTDGGISWAWKVENEDPFLLTDESGRDMCPSVSSIGNKVLVVWQSDRCGNWDIFFSEFDGTDFSESHYRNELIFVKRITDQDFPNFSPSIAADVGRNLTSLIGGEEHTVVFWETAEENNSTIHSLNLKSSDNTSQILLSTSLCGRFPDICYVSKYECLNGILQKDLWLVWQSNEFASSTSNIWCNNSLTKEDKGNKEVKITDDFSRNERPQIIEFKGKNWIFWDSNGGGNGKGIYCRYMYRKDFPFQFSIVFIVAGWVIFIMDVRSKGGVGKLMSRIQRWIGRWSNRHVRFTDIIIGIITGIFASIILQILH